MSAKTDELMNQVKGYYVNGGHGSVVKLGDTGIGLICNQITKEIAELEAERDEWEATATRAAEYCMSSSVVCDFCPHDSNNCIDKSCPVVDVQYILAHFGAPEDA